MSHLDEREMILLYYGETPRSAATEAHLSVCESCRAHYEALQEDLTAIDALQPPERGDDYGSQVWRRIEDRLDRPRLNLRTLFSVPRLRLAGAVAVLVLVAFFAGRWQGRTEPIPGAARERILLLAVGEHLDRSERLLVEIVNADAGGGSEAVLLQERAGRLVSDNRLYRRSVQEQDPQVAALLDELERILIEIANTSADPDPQLLTELQRRIDRRGILLKIRVIGEQTTQPRTEDRAAGRV